MSNLFIFSSDLRLEDNAALFNASLDNKGLTTAFIFNPTKWKDHNDSPLKIKFQLNHLQELREKLIQKNICFKVIHADGIEEEPLKILNLAKELRIKKIFINKDYGFNERRRDSELEKLADQEGISLNLFDSSIIDPRNIKTGTGNFFKVFTPYSKVFRNLLTAEDLNIEPEPKTQEISHFQNDEIPEYDLEEENFKNSIELYEVGSDNVYNKFDSFLQDKISDYKNLRDFPSLDSTSKLSPYLTSGMLSAKYCLKELLSQFEDIPGTGQYSWMNEILWREFYKYIIFHFPRVSQGKSFSEKYDQLIWRQDAIDFEKWCQGKTGIPLIDAAMTQLNQTGWMHNRLRMVVAMFLSKNLLIDWRLGEAYFMNRLIDGDHASNNGGWQWSASTGVDAAPYFRIFNPITQSEKFDKNGEFIKKYLPNLQSIPANSIHNPSKDLRIENNYPDMIVDLKESRKRALDAFSSI